MLQGFVISDWEGIDRITSPPRVNYTYSILTGVSAGIDMVDTINNFPCLIAEKLRNSLSNGFLKTQLAMQIMVPYNFTDFIDGLTSLVKNNFIPMSRIDDAVKRILRVKFTMGLFEHPLADHSMVNYLGHKVKDLGKNQKLTLRIDDNLLVCSFISCLKFSTGSSTIGKGSCKKIPRTAQEWRIC